MQVASLFNYLGEKKYNEHIRQRLNQQRGQCHICNTRDKRGFQEGPPSEANFQGHPKANPAVMKVLKTI